MWWPQIVANAWNGNKLVFSRGFVRSSSAIRGLTIMYVFLTPYVDDLAKADVWGNYGDAPVQSLGGAAAIVMWFSIQVYVAHRQSKHGARFFVPKMLLPKRYDYKRKRAPNGGGMSDCSICREPIDGGGVEMDGGGVNNISITPCSHEFHDECLKRWAVVRMTCPTCRAALPPLEDEGVENE
jgi:hypothetical protein